MAGNEAGLHCKWGENKVDWKMLLAVCVCGGWGGRGASTERWEANLHNHMAEKVILLQT